MEVGIGEPASLRKFLLGDVTPAEREAIEMWLMTSGDALDLVGDAEDTLIDDALRGRLARKDLTRFSTHFLSAPERQEKFQFARAFHRYLDEQARPGRKPEGFWTRAAELLQLRPWVGYAVAATLVLGAGVAIWSAFNVVRLQRELDTAKLQLQESGNQAQQLEGSLARSRTLEETLQAQIRELQQKLSLSNLPEAVQTTVAAILMPGVLRGGADIPVVQLRPDTLTLRLSLVLVDDDYSSYRAVLTGNDGRTLFTASNLRSVETTSGKVIRVSIPAETVGSSSYSIRLSGSAAGAFENISRYDFQITRP